MIKHHCGPLSAPCTGRGHWGDAALFFLSLCFILTDSQRTFGAREEPLFEFLQSRFFSFPLTGFICLWILGHARYFLSGAVVMGERLSKQPISWDFMPSTFADLKFQFNVHSFSWISAFCLSINSTDDREQKNEEQSKNKSSLKEQKMMNDLPSFSSVGC